MKEFWVSSGHHLTRRGEDGRLLATDELILAYLARPELLPPADACPAERALHAAMAAQPRRRVAAAEIAAIEDGDARENWRYMIALRDRLFAAPTLEAAYLGMIAEGGAGIPPLFMNQLVHLILRNALEGCEDPYALRAAELFFRPQRASLRDGTVLLADAEWIENREAEAPHAPLLTMMGQDPMQNLDVMTPENAWTYWSRSDAFSMVFNLGSDPRAREALAEIIVVWIRHLLGAPAVVRPLAQAHDAQWRWYVGLDAHGTRIGDALWRGESVSDAMRARLLGLFSLTFPKTAPVPPEWVDTPIYLLLGMSEQGSVRVKPQNLIAGLPVAIHKNAKGS